MNEMVMGTCILFGVLIVLMAFRFPISFCLAISAMVTGAYLHIPFMNLFQKMSTGITSFTFHVCAVFHYHGTDYDRRRYRRQTDGIL